MLQKFKCYWHTLKYLKFQQLYWQLRYRLYKSSPPRVTGELTLRSHNQQMPSWIQKSTYMDLSSIACLGMRKIYEPCNRWYDDAKDDLWNYNLHYFDFLQNPKIPQDVKLDLVNDWIDCVGDRSIGWQAYPVSLRIVNWIKWLIANDIYEEKIIRSLAQHVQHLQNHMEWHILANHLFANIKALVIAALFFSGKKYDRLLQKMQSHLLKQLQVQVTSDGGHFELSPMYHQIILEDVLDLISFYQLYSRSVPDSLPKTAKKMLVWSRAFNHPDGEVAFFNDSAMGIAPDVKSLDNFARSLGITVLEGHCFGSVENFDGYYIVQKKPWFCIFDAAAIGASFQPGHAHADTLSFELSVFNRRLMVNSGMSTYHEVPLRQWQRSTAAHNTLVIDHKNSTQVWSKFRVAERANVMESCCSTVGDAIMISARHDGYKSMHSQLGHKRMITVDSKKVTVFDEVMGGQNNDVTIYFYLHPNVQVVQMDGATVLTLDGYSFKVISDLPISVEPAKYFPSFNAEKDSFVLVVQAKIKDYFTSTVTVEIV